MWTGLLNRSSLMFLLGAAGFLHELILREAERPFLLALCGALMGLPFILAADGYIRNGRNGSKDDDDRWSHLP